MAPLAPSLAKSEMLGNPLNFSVWAKSSAPTPSSSATFKTVALFSKKKAAPPPNYGYDPFGLSKKPEDFAKYQAFELIHARWAMLGAAGFIIPEAFNKFGANCGPEAVWFKTGALLLDGNTLNYCGKNIPINLIAAVIAEIVLVGGAEYYRIINGLELEDKLHPGGPFDPLGLAKDPDQAALLKVKEIKNGRLAMFAMLGFYFQAYVTGEGPVENLAKHLSDPFGNNLLTVIAGTSERAPTL
ncbi:chlorophyll a-b binding protein CP26, chloroplastic-like [Gossypium australe]|uniref:Chlorophyll a-b binding protein, chloroplastic n=1 Tax=Gossypium australe TaxID=47621 RepID=A0A5B6WD10_9ROSI|nr:chlorophyll a-b binding protein CP26, chloroplastic-like [Gossypium australe]